MKTCVLCKKIMAIVLLLTTIIPFAYGGTIDSKYANSTYFYTIVDPVNDKPELIKQIPDTMMLSNFVDYQIDLSEHFIDVDGDTLTYSVAFDAGQVNCFMDSTLLKISGIEGWSGIAGITVTADDGQPEEEIQSNTFSTKSSPKVTSSTYFEINVKAFDMLAVSGLETYLKNELRPTIELTKQMEIQTVTGIYTIPGQPEKTIDCTETSPGSFKYTGVIPSFVLPTEGYIYFEVTDIYGHKDTFGPKTIKWHELELENELLVNYLFSGNTKNKAINSIYGDAAANGALLADDRYKNENRAPNRIPDISTQPAGILVTRARTISYLRRSSLPQNRVTG